MQQVLKRTGGHAVIQPLQPAVTGQGLGGVAGGGDSLAASLVIGGEIGEPCGEAPAAALRSSFRANHPAAQFDQLAAGQRGGEGGIGGLEHVVAFVKDQPGGPLCMVAPARRVDHDQRVVGDDQVSLRRGPRRAFDEALPVMRAPGIDAFAAPVGQRGNASLAEQRTEPAG